MDREKIDSNLQLFRDLLSCCGNLYLWEYDTAGSLLMTNCPHRVLDMVFRMQGNLDYILEKMNDYTRPFVMSDNIGLSWSAAFEKDGGTVTRIHVLGPLFTSQTSYSHIEDNLHTPLITIHWKPKFLGYLRELPIINLSTFFQYTTMLHYCVTEEKLGIGDFHFSQIEHREPETNAKFRRDPKLSYMGEQAMLANIRNGNLDFHDSIRDLIPYTAFVKIDFKSPLTMHRVNQVVFTALCIRAAIEGGISPENAYARGDAYIQNILEARSITDITAITSAMFEDFVNEVHRIRTDSSLSKQIRVCCDYIRLHLNEPIRIADLAGRVGYTDYYLSHKFKAETGRSINDYMKEVRIHAACERLVNTDDTIDDIADSLCFGSRSFFSKTFKSYTGYTPAAYRKEFGVM